MSDLISRSALKKEFIKEFYTALGQGADSFDVIGTMTKVIDNAPTIEERPKVDVLNKIPKDFVYDTETSEFYCYRNKYTGEEIHIIKPPKIYILADEIGQRPAEWCDDKCSVCGKGIEDLISSPEWYRNEEPNFCPFCGARVRIGEL